MKTETKAPPGPTVTATPAPSITLPREAGTGSPYAIEIRNARLDLGSPKWTPTQPTHTVSGIVHGADLTPGAAVPCRSAVAELLKDRGYQVMTISLFRRFGPNESSSYTMADIGAPTGGVVTFIASIVAPAGSFPGAK
jgi:hypothetical protein